MEFTSAGSGGPSLDEAHWDLPDNFYAHLIHPIPVAHAAEAFHQVGWNVRKTSWREYEVSSTWAELTLSPPGLIAGMVAPGHRERMLELFTELGLACVADPEESVD